MRCRGAIYFGMAKKMQVFVSSTYTDMLEERQAAVEAILSTGHIPAGMELFAAGDQSQWEVIKKWIDDSDVFMLLIGTRYGSNESMSGKSYIELEYDYAVERNKPLFALVMSQTRQDKKVKSKGLKITENDHGEKFKAFRDRVKYLIVQHFDTNEGIKNGVFTALRKLDGDPRVKGWVPSTEATSGLVLAEIARLSEENARLRLAVEQLGAGDPEERRLQKLSDELRSISCPMLVPPGSLFDLAVRLAQNPGKTVRLNRADHRSLLGMVRELKRLRAFHLVQLMKPLPSSPSDKFPVYYQATPLLMKLRFCHDRNKIREAESKLRSESQRNKAFKNPPFKDM